MQISRGKLDRLRRTPAESTAWTCGGYGTSRNRARSSDPDCLIFGFCPSGRGFASTLPSDGASRRPPLRLASPLSPPDLGRGLAPPSCQACPAHPRRGKRARHAQRNWVVSTQRVYDTVWTPQTAPTRSTGTLFTLEHDAIGRISSTRYDTDGRELTDERRCAPMMGWTPPPERHRNVPGWRRR